MSLLGPFSYGPGHHLGPSPIAPAWMTQQPPPWAPSPWVHFPHGSQDPSHSIHMSRLTLAQSHSPYRVLPYDLSDLPPSTLPTGPWTHKLPPAQGLHPTCPLPEVGDGGGSPSPDSHMAHPIPAVSQMFLCRDTPLVTGCNTATPPPPRPALILYHTSSGHASPADTLLHADIFVYLPSAAARRMSPPRGQGFVIRPVHGSAVRA